VQAVGRHDKFAFQFVVGLSPPTDQPQPGLRKIAPSSGAFGKMIVWLREEIGGNVAEQEMRKTAEGSRLDEANRRQVHWKRWGPYLSERQWATVREDYSENGDAWGYFPHEHSRSRAYRWGEDGLGGICDRHQLICFAFALWNGRDVILKERLFGLTGHEGNHGEDVKEVYFYLDSTPTHSYMKFLYKYPQAEFPYDLLLEENRTRTRNDPEYELMDSGVFNENRYFDFFVEYAKASADDVLIRVNVFNRGSEPAPIRILPTLWFRNTWSWGWDDRRPSLQAVASPDGTAVIEAEHYYYGKRWLVLDGSPALLFTENETNFRRLYGTENHSQYVKDAFHDFVVQGDREAVNPARAGTKVAADYGFTLAPGQGRSIRMRLTDNPPSAETLGLEFETIFEQRITEADEFYCRYCGTVSEDARNVQRQAFAGMLWNKQVYIYDVRTWLQGDPAMPPPPPNRRLGRNREWAHLYNADIVSMPDKWEYPWYAAWDLAFHSIVFAMVDPDYAKELLVLFLREWYTHPNGQLPAYEWNFSDVNPPLHAWAAWRVYKIEQRIKGKGDWLFLKRVFHKLMMNFTWWVNRKDPQGMNVFEGGFLGMDNIGVFDRSAKLPFGGFIEQSDGTSWMGMFCLIMLDMALELAMVDPAYEDCASKFFEHFVYIAHAMNDLGGLGIELWDQQDGFYYDVLHLENDFHYPLKVRSMVGLIPLFAVMTLEPVEVNRLTGFKRRMQWFIDHSPELASHLDMSQQTSAGPRRLLSIVNRERLVRVLSYMLDESEFLSPHGIRALSKYHQQHPYTLQLDGYSHRVDYEPAESTTSMFGGNSNWRGPVWFPMNFLLIESLQKFHHYFGESLKVEFPTGSGHQMSLWEVAAEISRRLTRLFLWGPDGRPAHGSYARFRSDPHWKDYVLFYEYFHGDNGTGLGASHQTGWSGLVAKLIEQSGE
jgi:Mannosylglycerate hydrolase MGH1-like glycoside hydrolase domain